MNPPATQYAKPCNKCGQPILMKQSGGKWAAFEPDGLFKHECQKSSQNTMPTSPPPQNPSQEPSFTSQQQNFIRALAREEVGKMFKKMMES